MTIEQLLAGIAIVISVSALGYLVLDWLMNGPS